MKMKKESLGLIAVLILCLTPPALGNSKTGLEARRNSTELFVGNRTVLKSWQSSTWDANNCFWGRSAEAEDFVSKEGHSYLFFHSKNNSYSDSGYHWLVLQLNSSAYVTAVSIKGRADYASSAVYNRSAGIEIWTSPDDVNFSGADHCSANNLSLYFISTRNHWRECGVTRARDGTVTKGEILTVNCTAEVKMLLLRRSVGSNIKENDGYMSFAGITLTIGQRVDAPKNTQMIGLLVAALVVFAVLCLVISAFVVIRRRKRRNQSGDTTHEERNAKAFAMGPNAATAAASSVAAIDRSEGASRYSSNRTLDQQLPARGTVDDECSYATVQPMAEMVELAMASSDAGSDEASECTVYLSIVGDGS